MKRILRLAAGAALALLLAIVSTGCSRHTYWGVEGDAPVMNAHYYVGSDGHHPPKHHKKVKHHKKPKPPKHHKDKHGKKGKHHHD